MTLKYKLFGIPGTFEEFVDKIKNKGQKQVNIVLGSYNDEGGLGVQFFNYHVYIMLESGNIRLKLNERIHMRLGDLYGTVVGKAEVEKNGLKDAIEAAERLQKSSLEVTVKGDKNYSVDEAKKLIDEYDAKIIEMKEKYGVSI